MAIDYSLFAIKKPQVKALDKAEARRELATEDRKESAKARKRANGRCEVLTVIAAIGRKGLYLPCQAKDAHTHHLIGGIGRRNKGKSILAAYKLRVCAEHHRDIHAKILRPTTAVHDAHTVRFWREK